MNSMEMRQLGRSGLRVSEIALGSWLTLGASVDLSQSTNLVEHAYDIGINFFDTADVYARGAAEEFLGKALRPYPRNQFVLASKCFFPMSDEANDRGLSRKHIFESVEASLNRLGTDYFDLHQCHRFDPDTPVEETVRAYEDLIRQGKVLYWGVSEWSAEQIAQACRIADDCGGFRPVSNQPNYSIMRRGIEQSVLPECRRLGLGQIVFSPLAQGVLSGKYCGGARPKGSRAVDGTYGHFMERYLEKSELEKVAALIPLAEQQGLSLAQLALAWCLRDPGLSSVIVGATRSAQLDENCAASGVELPDAVIAAIERIFPAEHD